MTKGRVVLKCMGSYNVYAENKMYTCSLKGNLKKAKTKPLVGDIVLFSKDDLLIETILPRHNELIRPSMANLDYGIIVVSLKKPDFSRELLNKFITFLNLHNVKSMIIFTKQDLGADEDVSSLVKHYQTKGYEVYTINKFEDIPEELLDALKDKVVAFVGQTGVGKSTLINKLIPDVNQKIGEYSEALKRGKHQTTNTILIPFKTSFVADTPGFSSVELSCYKEDFANTYLTYSSLKQKCYFQNCLHLKEKGCAIKENLLSKDDLLDYEIYQKLLDKLPYRKDRYAK